jgi:hypothetical protein
MVHACIRPHIPRKLLLSRRLSPGFKLDKLHGLLLQEEADHWHALKRLSA